MENTITNNRKAGFWVRFAAIWLDTLIICLLVNAATIILEQFGVLDNFEYLLAIGFIAYLVIFIGAKGRTIGKLLCGLTVQQINHKPTGYWRQFLREVAGKFIAAVFLLLGFLWAGFFRSKRGWHDYIARTEVIQDKKALKRGRLTLTAVLAINLLLISSGIAFSIVNFINLQNCTFQEKLDLA